MKREVDVYVIIPIIRPGLLGVWDAIKAVFYGADAIPRQVALVSGYMDIKDGQDEALTGESRPN